MKQVRLFHFDITTKGNYGDNLLFPMARGVFEQYAGGQAFTVVGRASLRSPVNPELVAHINRTADAVLVGGGGLFLRDTNKNSSSGWQWNIGLPELVELKVPIILFAVGNNRFIKQQDFAPIFKVHLRQVVEQSVFIGLRNHGSIDTIRPYLPDDLAERVRYQPCATTLSRHLYPNRVPGQEAQRRIAAQLIVGKRQQPHGFNAPAIYDATIAVLERLSGDGWTVLDVPYARADMTFADLLQARGIASERIQLYGARSKLFDGIDLYAHTPFNLGTRGHAQMVPFGAGALPFSVYVHDKLNYFAEDINRPEWVLDARDPGFIDAMYTRISTAFDDAEGNFAAMASRQQELFDLTVANVAEIYAALGGTPPEGATIDPLAPDEQASLSKKFDRQNRALIQAAEEAAAQPEAARDVRFYAKAARELARRTYTRGKLLARRALRKVQRRPDNRRRA